MQHAISNAGSLEAVYYRQLDRDHDRSLAEERIAQRAEQIIDSFDAKDAADALDASVCRGDRMHDRLSIALAALVQVSSTGHRPIVRAVIDAWHDIANSYANDLARKENGA